MPDAPDVIAVEVGRQTKFRIVGHSDCLFFGLKPEKRCHRAKGLLTGHQHVLGDVGEDGGLEEGAAKSVCLASHHNFCAPFCGIGDVPPDFVQRSLIDQWTLVGFAFQAWPHDQLANRRLKLVNKLVIHARLHINAVGAHTRLPGITVLGGH